MTAKLSWKGDIGTHCLVNVQIDIDIDSWTRSCLKVDRIQEYRAMGQMWPNVHLPDNWVEFQNEIPTFLILSQPTNTTIELPGHCKHKLAKSLPLNRPQNKKFLDFDSRHKITIWVTDQGHIQEFDCTYHNEKFTYNHKNNELCFNLTVLS
jgi:hypothetical protein